MALYYEQQLEIARGNQARKDREFAEEMKSRKLYPSEQKCVDEAMDDLLQMQLDDMRKINKSLDASIAESKSRMAKYDSLPSSSYSRRTSGSLIDKHYEQALANKYGRNGRKEGRSISTSNASKIRDHIDTVKYHANSLRTAADDFAETMQGAETPYAGSDPGRPADGQQEGKNRTGRYTSSSFGYEVKAFDEKTTTQRERKSLGVSQGFREWDHRTFAANVESKLGVR